MEQETRGLQQFQSQLGSMLPSYTCLQHPLAPQGPVCVHVIWTVKTWGRSLETNEFTS